MLSLGGNNNIGYGLRCRDLELLGPEITALFFLSALPFNPSSHLPPAPDMTYDLRVISLGHLDLPNQQDLNQGR